MRIILIIILVLFNVCSFGQTITFKCVVQDNETHETVENVKMQLICSHFTEKTTSYDTLISVSDSKGSISFSAKPSYWFDLQSCDKKYRQDKQRLNVKDTSKVIIYYLNAPGFRDYFPEFLFSNNSSIPQDTSMFYYWDLNTKQDTAKRILLTGFYAPHENAKIGRQRAEAVLNGFVKRGANPKSFVINDKCSNETELNYGHYVYYNNLDHFFKKGAIINKQYTDSLTGDRKEAAKQLLRSVRLEWNKN